MCFRVYWCVLVSFEHVQVIHLACFQFRFLVNFPFALIFNFPSVFVVAHECIQSSISLELTSKMSRPMECWCVRMIAQKSKLQKASRLSPNSTCKNELEFSELDHISPHHFWLPPMFFHLFGLTELCSCVQVQTVLNLDHYISCLTNFVSVAI